RVYGRQDRARVGRRSFRGARHRSPRAARGAERLQPDVLARGVRLAPRRISARRDDARFPPALESGVRHAGTSDSRHEGRGREARRDGQPGRDSGSGGVRSRGPAPEPQAQQGAWRDPLHVQSLMQDPAPREPRNDPPGLAQPFSDVRYSRWDGTQRLDALEAEELLGAMADELLSGGDLEDAMARLSRWGIPGRMEGLKDLLERLRTAKQRRAQRH